MSQTLNAVAALVALFLVSRVLRAKLRAQPLPPGPRGLPWFGYALSWPTGVARWQTYERWAKEYGPVVYLKAFGSSYVLLTTAEAAFELLDRRWSEFSERPKFNLLELTGTSSSLILSSYGPRLQRMRRMALKFVGKSGTENFADMVNLERHRFLRRMLEDPSRLPQHLFVSTSAAVVDVCYGYDISDAQDQILDLIRRRSQVFAPVAGIPNKWAENLTFLRHLPRGFPGMYLFEAAAKYRQYILEINERLYDHVKADIAAGRARSSLAGDNLNDENLSAEKEDLIQGTCLSLFNAGVPTTSEIIYSFIYAMTLYPEVQERAHAEIASVVGTERLPVLEDKTRLPYTSALVQEVLRWSTPVSGGQGVEHSSRQDAVFMGYFIPKETRILVNIRGILHDPKTYSAPCTFEPERFLGPNPERDPTDVLFGFGRRICPGADFAVASVFLYVTAMLSVYKISPPKDKPLANKLDWMRAPVFPAPLPCLVEPRSDAVRALIEAVSYRGESATANVA